MSRSGIFVSVVFAVVGVLLAVSGKSYVSLLQMSGCSFTSGKCTDKTITIDNVKLTPTQNAVQCVLKLGSMLQ